MRKFYYEYDTDDQWYWVFEEGGGSDGGIPYDLAWFAVALKEDAQEAVKLLHKLQEGVTK